jgi:glycosyltransferase involved in cell wall biosynthesis
VVDAVRTVESSFCSVSESCAAQWRAATGRPVAAVPNGVPTFHAPVGAVDDVALIAGRISREKGVAAAVRVARRAGLEPRVVGAVYDRDYYEREVAPELAPAKVQPARSRAALVRAMARSAVLLMPIEWDEPFGLVAAEAQRAGCPVVAYRRGALPELVRDGVDGVLVDPGDEEALVEGIARARRLDRLAIRSRAAARYDMAECALRYETALRALADR